MDDENLKKGIDITPQHLIISDRATICMPFHRELDGLEEDRLGDKKLGSTRRVRGRIMCAGSRTLSDEKIPMSQSALVATNI